ncbi:HDOD domain-containing protein [Telluria mixta]|uniref:HDOD domain-containing protein n=1 Tax=Telluria mixta TaxID=34071 RepID=A0ABT2BVB1_9BURK|nr:HDOD domain-containing protein [Telluria mixta]MCS0628369.1 HDOD domain-containing protein [Telluria mixta]WEM93523.1 HDOD domain-containing protein [Telluria mixta]
MFRWLHSLFSSPAAAPPQPVAEPVPVPAPAPVAAAPQPGTAPVSFEQLERINGAWNAWLFDRADGGLELSDAETRVLDALAAIAGSQQSGAALVRRMPGLVPQLLQSLRSETFSGSALSRTIASDPVLVAAVVRLANSCYKGTGQSITSVEQAVILIGQEGLRQLITTVAFRPIIDVRSGFYTRRLAPHLWAHSERCAIAARQMAGAGIEPFDAFLAGLLQNVGLIVSLRIMDQEAKDGESLGSDVFLAQLARDTRRLCASIAREWNFPETVSTALLEQGELRRGVIMSPLGRLLKLADYLGKVRMLVEQGLVDEADEALFAGLPPEAAPCYAALTEAA